MTGSFNNYLEEAILKHIFGLLAFEAPASLFIGVCTGGVAEDGTITGEPSGNGYARVAVSNDDTGWHLVSGAIKNLANIVFPEAEGDWGTIAYAFIADNAAPGQGNVLAYVELDIPKQVTTGDTLAIAADTMTISLD